jgi:hypothetical protein
MSHRIAPFLRPWIAALACLAFVLVGAPARDASAASKKKPSKSWPSKKHKARPASGASKAAPAKEEEEDGEAAQAGGQTGGDEEGGDEAEAAPKTKAATKSKVKMDKDEDDASDDRKGKSASSDEDDQEGEGDDEKTPVAHKKARRPVAEKGAEGAVVGLELDLGTRGVSRTFDFYQPLSDFKPVPAPGSYSLGGAPVPFVHLGLYPVAFADRGFLANIGLIGSYEQLIGTTTTIKNDMAPAGTPAMSSKSSGHEFEGGVRVRIPLGDGEIGVSGAYGQHSFHVTSADVAPGPGAIVPNVDYTFMRAGLDGRLRLGAISLGAHVGTRFVPKTGPLATLWFNSTKTTSVEAGVSVAYALTPTFSVVGGADFLRYAFDFNPVQKDNPVIAGGAVDQYISGYLALRVSLSGS